MFLAFFFIFFFGEDLFSFSCRPFDLLRYFFSHSPRQRRDVLTEKYLTRRLQCFVLVIDPSTSKGKTNKMFAFCRFVLFIHFHQNIENNDYIFKWFTVLFAPPHESKLFQLLSEIVYTMHKSQRNKIVLLISHIGLVCFMFHAELHLR